MVAKQWPGSFDVWRDLIAETYTLDLDCQRILYSDLAPKVSADFLVSTVDRLWGKSIFADARKIA